jgi:hypothetical protein
MINLGEITDPMTRNVSIDLEKAQLFIDLIQVLEKKTKGNLSDREIEFINEIQNNLNEIYNKKINQEKQK